MSLLNTVARGTKTLTAGTGALSLVSATKALLTNPGAKGISGFLFSIPLNEEVTISAQITDHWIEDNTSVQDHIALEPIRLRLTGIVAELVYEKDKIEAYVNQVLDRLGPLNVIQPAGAASTRQWLSQYNQTSQAINNAVNEFSKTRAALSGGQAPKDRQQSAYDKFENWMLFRSWIPSPGPTTVFASLYKPAGGFSQKYEFLTVVTPWRTFENMAIETVIFSQDETTRDLSTVEVTLKQIRSVSIVKQAKNLSNRAAGPGGVVEKAKSPGVEVSIGYGTATGERQ